MNYGSGNDTAIFDGFNRVTFVDTGGTNKYTIGSASVSTGIEESRLTLNGNNTLTVQGKEMALEESTLLFKGGNSTVALSGGKTGIDDSQLTFTTGTNKLSITGSEKAVVESGLHFNGQGNASVTLEGKVALEKSNVNTGSGNDTISLTGSVKNSNINTGAGKDTILLNGEVASSTINAGAGNDIFVATQSTLLKSGATLIGGDGLDTLDISGRATTSLEQMVASGAMVKGVEILSMNGGGASTLQISNNGLSRFIPDNLKTGLAGKSIMRITGDANDKVDFAGNENWALASGSQTYTIDGVKYALWQNASGRQVLVQEGLATSGETSGSGNSGSGSGGSESGSSGSGSSGSGSSGSGSVGGGSSSYIRLPILDNTNLDYSNDNSFKKVILYGQSGVSMRNSSLALGNGSDVVNLDGKMMASSIDLGGGHNKLHIQGSVTGTAQESASVLAAAGDNWSEHVSFSKIAAGNGNDNITVNGRLDSGVDINLGDGVNSLVLTNEVHYTQITGGSGKDNLVVKGLAQDVDVNLGDGYNNMVFNNHVVESHLRTGTGADTITITGNMVDSSVSTGAGNDKVVVWNVDNSDINLGAGHDNMIIKGDFLGNLLAEAGNDYVFVGGTMENGSFIDLGAGNDTIALKGMDGGTLLGGSGTDTLTLILDEAGSPFSSQGKFSGLFSGSKSNARGFENLILDMEEKRDGDLTLTQQQIDNLRKVASSNGTDANANLNLWIEGDNNDSVTVAGDYQYAGRTTYDNHSFNHYVSDDGLNLYVQQGMLLNFIA